jgi:hypothetical protein
MLTYKLVESIETSKALGSLNIKYAGHSLIVAMLFVLNSFKRNLFSAKSNELKWFFLRSKTSNPFNSIGKHLVETSCKTTSI